MNDLVQTHNKWFPRGGYHTSFEDLAAFTQDPGVSGVITQIGQGVELTSGATSGSYAKITKEIVGGGYHVFTPDHWEGGGAFALKTSNAKGEYLICTGDVPVSGSGHTFKDPHVGFKVVVNAAGTVRTLYATIGDGSQEEALSIININDADALDLYWEVVTIKNVKKARFYYRLNGGPKLFCASLQKFMPPVATASGFVHQSSCSNVSNALVQDFIVGIGYYYR